MAMMPIVAEYQLAQINIARLRGPLDSPEMRDFIAVLAEINRLAESAPGFVWRHPSGFGHLSGADLLGDDLITINLSVWESYQPLHNFTYRSHHGSFVRRRSQWVHSTKATNHRTLVGPRQIRAHAGRSCSPAPTLTQLRADAASVHDATSLRLPRRGKRRY